MNVGGGSGGGNRDDTNVLDEIGKFGRSERGKFRGVKPRCAICRELQEGRSNILIVL